MIDLKGKKTKPKHFKINTSRPLMVKIRDKQLSHTCFRILEFISCCGWQPNPIEWRKASWQNFEDALGISRQTVRNSFVKLVELGYLSYE